MRPLQPYPCQVHPRQLRPHHLTRLALSPATPQPHLDLNQDRPWPDVMNISATFGSAVWQWDEDKRSPLSINLKPNMDAHILLRIKCTADYVQSNAPFGAGLRPTHTHPKHGEGPTMHSMRIQIECSTQAHWQMRCLSIQWRQKESTRCILHVQQMWCVWWVWWGWWVWWLWWWLLCL